MASRRAWRWENELSDAGLESARARARRLRVPPAMQVAAARLKQRADHLRLRSTEAVEALLQAAKHLLRRDHLELGELAEVLDAPLPRGHRCGGVVRVVLELVLEQRDQLRADVREARAVAES